jgi:hypothetical protein
VVVTVLANVLLGGRLDADVHTLAVTRIVPSIERFEDLVDRASDLVARPSLKGSPVSSGFQAKMRIFSSRKPVRLPVVSKMHVVSRCSVVIAVFATGPVATVLLTAVAPQHIPS